MTILGQGYDYRDEVYGNLWEIARLITRTRWNDKTCFSKTFAHPSEVLREIDGMAGFDDKNGPPSLDS